MPSTICDVEMFYERRMIKSATFVFIIVASCSFMVTVNTTTEYIVSVQNGTGNNVTDDTNESGVISRIPISIPIRPPFA